MIEFQKRLQLCVYILLRYFNKIFLSIWHSTYILGDDSWFILRTSPNIIFILCTGSISLHRKWWFSTTNTILSFVTISDPRLLYNESHDARKEALPYCSLAIVGWYVFGISFVLNVSVSSTKKKNKKQINCRIVEWYFRSLITLRYECGNEISISGYYLTKWKYLCNTDTLSN